MNRRSPRTAILPPDVPSTLVPPGQRRPKIWRSGILQLHVTRACDLACHHCSQGSNLAGKPALMTPDQFEQAVDSLDGYFGVYGTFGGNPALSPHFEAYCDILRAKVPFEQRGLWCNNLRGKGAAARATYNPAVSNLNVHLDTAAYEEFARDWPESVPYLKGRDEDSVHGSPWVALKDVVPDEKERLRLIGQCDVSKWWSAIVGVVPGRGLRAYFCEIAYAQAALHADDPDWPDVGMVPEPGWWRRPLADFADQVRLHCHSCGIPLRRPGQPAIAGSFEEFSKTHEFIARPKVKDRPVVMVESIGMPGGERPDRPATEYLDGTTPGYRRR